MREVAEDLPGGGADCAVGIVLQREKKGAGAGIVEVGHRVDGDVADALRLVGGEGFCAERELLVAVLRVIEVGEDGEHFGFYIFAALRGEKAIEQREGCGGSGVGEFADGGDAGGGVVLGGEQAALDGVRVHHCLGRRRRFDGLGGDGRFVGWRECWVGSVLGNDLSRRGAGVRSFRCGVALFRTSGEQKRAEVQRKRDRADKWVHPELETGRKIECEISRDN